MRRRAEQVDETRLRITEAAVRLHTSVGPSQTSIAAVAEEAGVTRLTVYRHFTDAEALFQACMAHWSEQNPRPDAAAWMEVADLDGRARRAFTELYGWYRAHADALYPLYRDTDAMPASAQRQREKGLRMAANALIAGHVGRQGKDARALRAVARHLVDFWTWHSLASRGGLDDQAVVELAVRWLLVSVPASSAS